MHFIDWLVYEHMYASSCRFENFKVVVGFPKHFLLRIFGLYSISIHTALSAFPKQSHSKHHYCNAFSPNSVTQSLSRNSCLMQNISANLFYARQSQIICKTTAKLSQHSFYHVAYFKSIILEEECYILPHFDG